MNRLLFRIHDQGEPGCHPLGVDGHDVTYEAAHQWNEQKWGIFHTVNLFTGFERKASELAKIDYWIADLDSGAKPDMLAAIHRTLSPGMIIETKRGYHCYWRARDATVDNHRKIQDGIIETLNADPNAKDLSRILRVPGYLHWKEEPFYVRTVFESSVSYREKFMLKHFGQLKTYREEVAPRQHDVPAGELYSRVTSLDCRAALSKLSGTPDVNGEKYSFQSTANGNTNIFVNGKPSSCWVDPRGRIGSLSHGGPTIWQWLYWIHKDHSRVFQIVRRLLDGK